MAAIDAAGAPRPRRRVPANLGALAQWASDHDDVCADRWAEVRDELKWMRRGIVAVLLSAVGGLVLQLWHLRGYVPPAPAAPPAAAAPLHP